MPPVRYKIQSAEQVPQVAQQTNLPKRIDRRRGAALITELFFPISHRTLESWPLIWVQVNGRATIGTVELLAEAEARLANAARIRGGRRSLQLDESPNTRQN
jgi:hypothetical protein